MDMCVAAHARPRPLEEGQATRQLPQEYLKAKNGGNRSSIDRRRWWARASLPHRTGPTPRAPEAQAGRRSALSGAPYPMQKPLELNICCSPCSPSGWIRAGSWDPWAGSVRRRWPGRVRQRPWRRAAGTHRLAPSPQLIRALITPPTHNRGSNSPPMPLTIEQQGGVRLALAVFAACGLGYGVLLPVLPTRGEDGEVGGWVGWGGGRAGKGGRRRCSPCPTPGATYRVRRPAHVPPQAATIRVHTQFPSTSFRRRLGVR